MLQPALCCPWEGAWSHFLVVVAVATFPRCRYRSSYLSGPSPQWPHVKSDEEHRERHPLRHWALGSGHHDYALLTEGAALLPRLDVRRARQNEPKHQDLDGNYLSLVRVTRTLAWLELCSALCVTCPQPLAVGELWLTLMTLGWSPGLLANGFWEFCRLSVHLLSL